MSSPSNEARVILALEAIQNNPKLSLRAAAKIYNVTINTIRNRRSGRPARHDIPANSRNLTDLEEQTIVQYIIELSARAFPPRLRGVEDMANYLRRERDMPPVGQRWAHNFVKRQPELRTRYTRRYDYQRAKCEDPKVIGEWFALVRNVKAKYGIVDDDIYNFDETGFMMGIIFAGMVVTAQQSVPTAGSVLLVLPLQSPLSCSHLYERRPARSGRNGFACNPCLCWSRKQMLGGFYSQTFSGHKPLGLA